MPKLSQEVMHALQMAMQNELDTIHIYKKMSEKVTNQKTLQILKNLIEEEYQHKEVMQKKIEEKGGEILDANYDFPELPNRQQLLEIELENCTVSELISLAIENEKISRDFYKIYYQRFDHQEVKDLFYWLIQQEEEHILRLEKDQDSHTEYDEVGFPIN
jgi:rubrerythrin